MNYEIEIAGLKRNLPLCPINNELYIAAFVMFGDVEITEACAKALLEQAPDFDVIVTAESKGIPLAYEMAKQSGGLKYIVLRKAPKLYMRNVVSTSVDSITTDGIQTLCLGSDDADFIKGKRVLIVDDVISTGGSIKSMEELIGKVGGEIVGRMTVLAEGEAISRGDITFLKELPLFNADGSIK